ncbi:thiosulfate/3-mercaptopyruvate sulfurtransferase [Granulicella aggregans]|uniref:3-mercaptopyruvate sulfurtransferase n=1 Tax=Granulicella aggregans TaxID=474949 RepID=A0A7W7Z9V2_9BACT|nr:thiosulfate/3-mercaptopyruvate sulfurtransferase [Granulicella aggregans]
MNYLVSPAWLKEHLSASDIIVLDASLPLVGVTPVVDVHARYLEAHIPGAVFFDIEALSDHETSLPHMLPSPEAFALSMAALGVSSTAHLVVYEQQPVFSAPRAWWTLRAFGAKRVSMLDGGLPAWISSGGPTEPGSVHRSAAQFTAVLDPIAVKDLASIKDLLASHAQVVDARSAARFNGTAPEPRPGLRSGHMPGATSLPFGELVQDGRLRPREELRSAFEQRGLDLNRPITTTCGSGVTASVLALALELAGADDISLYDGSWAEYASQPDAEIMGTQA